MKFKSLIAILLVCTLMLATFAGCGGSKSEAAAEKSEAAALTRSTTTGKADNSLTFPMSEATTTLDPHLHGLQCEDTIAYQVYEPLILENNAGEILPILVEEYVVAEDGSSVEFTLKSDVKFHSGDVLVAEDVEYSFQRCELSPLASNLFAYATLEVIDDTHFTMSFPYAAEGAGFYDLYPYFQSFFIANKSYCEEVIGDYSENLGYNCDGTGAYSFAEISNTGDITLKRFADYHGTASIDTVYYKVITGSHPFAFESGDVDFAQYQATDFENIAQYENVYAYKQAANNVYFVINNCTEASPLNDIRVREAAARTMNRADIALMATNGSGDVAYNMATPVVGYYADVCDHYDPDLDKANKLMGEAGYSESNKCELTLICMADPAWVAGCEIIKENLEQSYFTVTIEQIPDTTRYFTLDFDMGFIAIGLTTAFNSYSVLFDDASGFNLSGISGDLRDSTLEAFANISDEATTHEAMKAVIDTLAYIPICYTTVFLAYDADLNCGDFYVAQGSVFCRDFSWKA